ncbi:MAG TPA: hypothetical protein VD837_15230 [Terriglobales bacterium]|nr:hypothetical protein [Terriglobales bacterium]
MAILAGTIAVWVVLAASVIFLFLRLRNVPSARNYLWTKVFAALLMALAFGLRLSPPYVNVANWLVGIGLAIWVLATILFRPRRHERPLR